MGILFAILLAAVNGGPMGPASGEGHETRPATPVTAELTRLEDDFARAVVQRDGTTMQRLLAEGFIYTENDTQVTREALVHELTTGSDHVLAATNQDMTVRLFGETAMVTGWLVIRGQGEGGPFERRYRFTDTWQLRGKRWQLIGAHDYLVPSGAH